MRVGADPPRTGRAVDLPGADPAALVRAIEGDEDPPVRVEAPPPGPLHEYVNPVDPGIALPVRAALAAAARTRGIDAPHDGEIATIRSDLDGLDPDPVDAGPARKRAAGAGDREAELAERVAELRGRLRAREDEELDAGEVREKLSEAAADLAEARTERLAAEQELDRIRERARRQRDLRERRLELEDRLGNLRREAREHLAGTLWGEFRDAVAAVPGEANVGEDPGSYEGDDVTAALATVRVADTESPVVLACDRFPDAEAAVEVLDAPVISV